MECSDVRLLLAFSRRGCEKLDAAERVTLQHHLDRCPDCASLAQADSRLDETLGQLMRDVPVPPGLKEKVLTGLSAGRGKFPWQRVAAGFLTLAVVLLTAGGLTWYLTGKPSVTEADVIAHIGHGDVWDVNRVEEYFRAQGLDIRAPRNFDYKFLKRVRVVEFKKQRVAELSFAGSAGADSADVLIFPAYQFRLQDLPEMDVPASTSIRIMKEPNFAYLIYYWGNLEELLHRPS